MIQKIYFLTFLLKIGLCLLVDVKNQCQCSQYSTTMCEFDQLCSINENVCGPLICKNRSKDFCSGVLTKFNCDYDETINECKQKKYNCNELEEIYCQNSDLFEMECVWTKDEKCQDLDCSLAKTCPLQFCALKEDICQARKVQTDCKTLSMSECTGLADGFGQICLMDNENQCESYEIPLNCQEWNDQPMYYCQIFGCVIENQKCRDSKCWDITQESKCQSIYYEKTNSISICKWSNNQCIDATETDIGSFSQIECLFNTDYTYTWQNSKCVACVINNDSHNDTNDTEIGGSQYNIQSIKANTNIPIFYIDISSNQNLIMLQIVGIGLLFM